MGWWVGLGSVGPKGAGWVPAGSLLTSLLAGCLLAGWLAGLIHFATDLLLPWFKGLGTKRQKISKKCHFFTQKEHPAPQKPEVLHEKLKTVLPMVILKFIISTPNFTKF